MGKKASWDTELAVRLAEEGKTAKEIGEEVGIDAQTFRVWAKKHGVKYMTEERLKKPEEQDVVEEVEPMESRSVEAAAMAAIAKIIDRDNPDEGDVYVMLDRIRGVLMLAEELK